MTLVSSKESFVIYWISRKIERLCH